jgi:hypothetical protein
VPSSTINNNNNNNNNNSSTRVEGPLSDIPEHHSPFRHETMQPHYHHHHHHHHTLKESDEFPIQCAPLSPGCHHDGDHLHGPNCGHERIQHEDLNGTVHIDYLVDNYLHHYHEGHCDIHGTIMELSQDSYSAQQWEELLSCLDCCNAASTPTTIVTPPPEQTKIPSSERQIAVVPSGTTAAAAAAATMLTMMMTTPSSQNNAPNCS